MGRALGLTLLLLTAAIATANAPLRVDRRFSTILSAQDIAGGGDRDATGRFNLLIETRLPQVCYSMVTDRMARPTEVHVHFGSPGTEGPVAVTLPVARLTGGCAFVTGAMARAILEAPSAFYADVHTVEHPTGAVRGQFSN